jgi:hypothetical protein
MKNLYTGIAAGLALALGVLCSAKEAKAVYVVGAHGMNGKASDLKAISDQIETWNSGYVVVRAKWYVDSMGDYGDNGIDASAGQSTAWHNIDWHGPGGVCNGNSSQATMASDATKACGWNGTFGWSLNGTNYNLCVGHNWDANHKSFDHNMDTDIAHLSNHMAWFIRDHWGYAGTSVKYIGHSMGGLMFRSMNENRGVTAWPATTSLNISDAVTLDSPHQGVSDFLTTFGGFAGKSVNELGSGHPFMHSLNDAGHGNWTGDLTRIAGNWNGDANQWGADDNAQVGEGKTGSQFITGYNKDVGHGILYGWGSDTPRHDHAAAILVNSDSVGINGLHTCDAMYLDNGHNSGNGTHNTGNTFACRLRAAYLALGSTAW